MSHRSNVIINPQVSTQTDDCEARWKTVRTIVTS
jgi:hypothetical protein